MAIDPQFYAVRWLTTLYSRELPLDQVLRVWDALLADPERFMFMYCIGITLIEQEKDKLIKSDFAEIISLLVPVVVDLMDTCTFYRI